VTDGGAFKIDMGADRPKYGHGADSRDGAVRVMSHCLRPHNGHGASTHSEQIPGNGVSSSAH